MTLNQVICRRKTPAVLNSFLSAKLFLHLNVPVPFSISTFPSSYPTTRANGNESNLYVAKTLLRAFQSFQQFFCIRRQDFMIHRDVFSTLYFIQYFYFQYQINYISLLFILISILHSFIRIVFQLFVPRLRRNFPRRQIKCFKEVL